MSLPLQSAPEEICILRLSAVGDVCHTVPVVRRIQHFWPQTRLTWIIGKLESTLVGDIPGIEFIIFDKSKGWSAYQNLHQKLKGRHFDVLLQMQVSLRASLASLLIPAEIKLGFDSARAKDSQWLFTNHKINSVPHQHVMDGLLEFSRTLGVKDDSIEWDIPISEEAKQFAAQVMPESKKYLLISPCSSARFRNWRNWDVESYAKVADHVTEHFHLQVVLTGGPTEIEKRYGDEICELAVCKPINMIGKTSLKQLLAMMDSASVLISPDSGPAHMATTVNTPVIGLYVTSNPARTGPYLSQQWVVNKYPDAIKKQTGKSLEQIPWGLRVRDENAMGLITVEDVISKLDGMVKCGLI